MLDGIAVPTRVVASAATGIATSEPYNCVPQTEDTITLLVDWESVKSKTHKGTAVYTASWTAPLKAGIHSAQHWYYMAEKVRFVELNQILHIEEIAKYIGVRWACHTTVVKGSRRAV